MEAWLLTASWLWSGSGPPQRHMALLVCQGRLQEIGPTVQMQRRYPHLPQRQHPKGLVLQPMVNAHCHLELSALPDWARQQGLSLAAGQPFAQWLEQVIQLRLHYRQAGQAYQQAIAQGNGELLACGTGAVADHLAQPGLASWCLRQWPYRRLYAELVGRDTPSLQQQARQFRQAVPQYQNLGFAPHAPYSLQQDALHGFLASSEYGQAPLSCHIAESPAEVGYLAHGQGPLASVLQHTVHWPSLGPQGQRPLAWLERTGAVGPCTLLIHGVQLTSREIDRVAHSGARLVLCPRSNAWLQTGRAPLAQLVQARVPLALGTDSLASNSSLNLWQEAQFAHRQWPGLDPWRWLQMATVEGAAALGLQCRLGPLRPGKAASFQVVTAPDVPAAAALAEALLGQDAPPQVEALFLQGQSMLES